MTESTAPSERLPVGPGEFRACMASLVLTEPPTNIAVAVSGGADSMALMMLADRWARSMGGTAIGLTVDHGLRRGSADEARQVGVWLKARSIKHQILKWEPNEKVVSAVQERARIARYGLMADWCAAHGAQYLLVGHHLEDQAETFLMRLSHESGLDGLAAMAPSRYAFDGSDLLLLRPLLAISKLRLCQTLIELGQPWIEDPSNLNPAFERVRTRSLVELLARHEGISPQSLAGAARGAGALKRALESFVDAFLAAQGLDTAKARAQGAIDVPLKPFLALDGELQRRTLTRLIAAIGGGNYPPPATKMARLLAWVQGEKAGRGRTLGHCRLSRQGGFLHVTPEGPRRARMVNKITEEKPGVFLVQARHMPYILGNGQSEKPSGQPLQPGL